MILVSLILTPFSSEVPVEKIEDMTIIIYNVTVSVLESSKSECTREKRQPKGPTV